MRARASAVAAFLVPMLALAGDPKPTPIDIKPFRDQLLVLQDAQGGTYAVLPGDESRVFYGPAKTLYEQIVIGRSSNGEGKTKLWTIDIWAPRVPNLQPGSIIKRDDGTYLKFCGDDKQVGLTQLTGDKAKAALDKAQIQSSALVRRPYLFARDDAGVYYYIDHLSEKLGGKGFRVFVGKKGAMKQLPLTDVANDSGGDVFATKTGDLRFVKSNDDAKGTMSWVRGEKKTPLVSLDVDANSHIIFAELGVYAFIGTICDDV